jgi:phosphonopyruvate decarboxylase
MAMTYTAAEFCRELSRLGSDFSTGVPDSSLGGLCAFLQAHPPRGGHVQVANEGGAIALAAGRHLAAGTIPVVYMQNSGLGNAINPLLSLADPDVYAIPMLLLVGWRGEPETRDEPQHRKQGRTTIPLLDAMDIPHGILDADWRAAVRELETAYAAMKERSRPYALLVRKTAFAIDPSVSPAASQDLKRREAIRIILDHAGGDAAFVASTGFAGRELYDLREERSEGHERDFLNVGAMGHASMLALGIADALPDRRVVCLDGDGALLMHLGALAIVGEQSPPNLTHILLNNGTHDSVGGQPNAAMRVDLAAVAGQCGYARTYRAATECELHAAAPAALAVTGPAFLSVRIARRTANKPGRPAIPLASMAQQFQGAMRNQSSRICGQIRECRLCPALLPKEIDAGNSRIGN